MIALRLVLEVGWCFRWDWVLEMGGVACETGIGGGVVLDVGLVLDVGFMLEAGVGVGDGVVLVLGVMLYLGTGVGGGAGVRGESGVELAVVCLSCATGVEMVWFWKLIMVLEVGLSLESRQVLELGLVLQSELMMELRVLFVWLVFGVGLVLKVITFNTMWADVGFGVVCWWEWYWS